MRFITHRAPRLLAGGAAIAAVCVAVSAQAQYAPYTAGQTAYVSPNQYPPNAATAQPQYAAQGAYQGYSQPTSGYASPGYGATPTYVAPTYGTNGVAYTARAYQSGTPATPPSGDALLAPPIETVPAGSLQGGAYVPQPTPQPESYGAGAPANYGGYAPGGGCDPQAAATCNGGCNTGYGACDTTAYGACNTYSTYGGMGGFLKHGGCGYWFGGAYGLLMDRDNSNKYPLVFTAASMPPSSYPSIPSTVVLDTRDVDVGFQPGVEFRLGRTFGCGPVDPCSCCSTCGPRWGLEGVYWTLFEDDAYAQYVDQGTLRTYTMMPMYGLQYNNGSGYRPVNEYWDHAPPTPATTDIEVRLARVRSSLEVQNLEINLLRLSVCGGGCGGTTCDATCGASACGGCDTGYSTCAGGCGTGYGACGPRYGSRFSCTGVCGFRWMQFDEDFMFGVDFDNTSTAPTIDGNLDYWANVENNLFGAQIGCNGMYRVGCRWGLHLNTLFGLYGNDIDVRQYFMSPTNDVTYVITGEDFDVRAYKTDVAMLGELRLGASYQYSCRCRLYGGWRAIGVTGIALATDQTPNVFQSASQMAQYVNSNGSMILHGLQAGVEYNY